MSEVTKKKIKWDAANSAEVQKRYEAGESPENIAAALDTAETEVTKRMVIGKLTNLNVYQAPEKKPAKPKDESKSKGERLTAIKEAGYDPTGLDGATKNAIAGVAQLVNDSDQYGPVAPEFCEPVENA